MPKQFQHFVQKAYLERWKVGPALFLYDKKSGGFVTKSDAKRILGRKNMQSAAMEAAFSKIESCVGHTDHAGEMFDRQVVRLFAEWMALHLVRNALNSEHLAGLDYEREVRRLGVHLGRHFGFWMDFNGEVFITGDNPVVSIIHQGETFYIATLSPRRCVYLIAEDKIPSERGKPGLMPPTINRHIHNAASRYCVSFDADLHF